MSIMLKQPPTPQEYHLVMGKEIEQTRAQAGCVSYWSGDLAKSLNLANFTHKVKIIPTSYGIVR